VLFGQDVEVVGNVLWMSGHPFSVDAECVGIYLMLTALAVSVLCLALAEYKSKVRLRLPFVAGVILLSFGAVIAANLMRILTLVVTGWGPAHVMHGTVGLLAFAAYVLLPLALGTRWLAAQKWAVVPVCSLFRSSAGLSSAKPPLSTKERSWKLARIASVPLLLLGLVMFQAHRSVDVPPAPVNLFGILPEVRANGVLGYALADAIVYVKPVPAFYQAEHSPTVCWRGSGYLFSQIEKTTLATGGEIYTARLVRDEVVLYTAWWMDNGSTQTLNQAEWRRRMAIGEAPFRLVNVTAENLETLACRVGELYGGFAF